MDSEEEQVYQEPNPYQEVNVYPNIKVYKTICKAQIKILEIKLFEHITIMVRLLDENDVIAETRILVMDKTNGYNNWGSDDQYVLKWVKEQLSTL
jgi:hypothetical protein